MADSRHKLGLDANGFAQGPRPPDYSNLALLRSTLASDWYAVVAEFECPTALIAAKLAAASLTASAANEKLIPLVPKNKNNAFNHAELAQLINQLCGSLLNPNEAVRALLLSVLSVLSGQNVLQHGPPSMTKSLAHLIGSIDVQSLTTVSVSQRNLGDMLAGTKLTFLDEIFKASKATLSCLMTILNERRIANGSTMVATLLHVYFGASNEVPLEVSQAALMDRFPLRVFFDCAEYRAAGPPAAAAGNGAVAAPSTEMRKGGAAWMDSLFAAKTGAQSQQTYGGRLLTDRGIVVLLKVLRVVVYTKDQHQCLVQWLEARLVKELAALVQTKGIDAVTAMVKAHAFVPDAAKQRILEGIASSRGAAPASAPVVTPAPTPVAPAPIVAQPPQPKVIEHTLTVISKGFDEKLGQHGHFRVSLGNGTLVDVGGPLEQGVHYVGIHVLCIDFHPDGKLLGFQHFLVSTNSRGREAYQLQHYSTKLRRTLSGGGLNTILREVTIPETALPNRVIVVGVFDEEAAHISPVDRESIQLALRGPQAKINSLGIRHGFAGASQLRVGESGKLEKFPLGQEHAEQGSVAKLECKVSVPVATAAATKQSGTVLPVLELFDAHGFDVMLFHYDEANCSDVQAYKWRWTAVKAHRQSKFWFTVQVFAPQVVDNYVSLYQ
ncbi:hypothetical protein H9P43_005436 [Blastocladiella emersonii ATCC 22665]|nr:hypothetical protein H9P43_005436 [Blastocladiella emersonii ATCC 22665]